MTDGKQPGTPDKEGIDPASRPPTDDDHDVQGHDIGPINQILARELARAREQDVARTASRNSMISEIRRAVRRKP